MINHLKRLEINSIYDFDNSFSINELLCKFWEKIEESINISNESIDVLNWIKEQGLANEVQVLINQLVADGTIEKMVNIPKIEELINQLVADGTIEQMINITKIEELTNLINIKYDEINNKINNITNEVKMLKDSISTLTNKQN